MSEDGFGKDPEDYGRSISGTERSLPDLLEEGGGRRGETVRAEGVDPGRSRTTEGSGSTRRGTRGWGFQDKETK